MADEAPNPLGAVVAAHAAPAPALGGTVGPEPPKLDESSLFDLADSIQNALKRPRSPDPNQENGDEKRHKTEPDAVATNWDDLGAMLQDALGSLDQADPILPAPELDDGVKRDLLAPSGPGPVPSPRWREQKKMRFSQNPTYIVRSMGLPLLGSLAVQVLHALSEKSPEESPSSITDETSDVGKAYKALKATFDHTRRMFSDSSPILLPEELDIKELGDQETIQMANMATICASVFEANDVPLIDVHDHFLMTFLPEANTMTADLARLFLSLKTQTFLRSLPETDDEASRRALIERLFPLDIEEQLKQLHPETPLVEQEQSFLAEAAVRKAVLEASLATDQSKLSIADEHPYNAFRDDLKRYLQDNADVVLKYAESQGIEIPADEEVGLEDQLDAVAPDSVDRSLAAAIQEAASSLSLGAPNGDLKLDGLPSSTNPTGSDAEGLGLGKLIQESLQQSVGSTQAGSAVNGSFEASGLASLINQKLGQSAHPPPLSSQYQSPLHTGNATIANMPGTYASHLAQYQQHQQQQQQQHSPFQSYQATQFSAPSGTHNASLPPNQSSPSAILYQRARQAAAAKTSAHARREGLHSTRRPWTSEEEQALMTGLDMVKGPHWSQILQLFGPNGTVSDILKDRSQVQLKDKARNLKLFFLKTNSEMPYYLQSVTGELKTRAPSQAARKEAEERARMTSEEEQARVQGIMTLAGGLQNRFPNVQNGTSPRATLTQPLPVPPRPLGSPATAGIQGHAVAALANGNPGQAPLQAKGPVQTSTGPTPASPLPAVAPQQPSVKLELAPGPQPMPMPIPKTGTPVSTVAPQHQPQAQQLQAPQNQAQQPVLKPQAAQSIQPHAQPLSHPQGPQLIQPQAQQPIRLHTSQTIQHHQQQVINQQQPQATQSQQPQTIPGSTQQPMQAQAGSLLPTQNGAGNPLIQVATTGLRDDTDSSADATLLQTLKAATAAATVT